MMIATAQSFVPRASPSAGSLRALDAVNFFVAASLAGFGPFVAVFLGEQTWSQEEIGLVLSIGAAAGLLAQVPGGELLDVVRSKCFLIALGMVMVGLSAGIIALWPAFAPVCVALVLQGVTGGFLGTAITSISLGLVGHDLLGERLGRNQCFRSIGSLAAAAILGAVGYFLSNRAIFFATALFVVPALAALGRINADDIHFGQSVGVPDHHLTTEPSRARRRQFWGDRGLLTLACSLFLFQMADAAILPLIGGTLAKTEGSRSALIMSVLLVVPQIVVALMAPWAGRRAKTWGRRPLLIIGFSVVPARALAFAMTTDPVILAAVQVLDGISGAVLGVLQALIIADLTIGTGRFNFVQGLVGVASGIGASVSTTLFGLIADSLGRSVAFLAISVTGLLAVVVVWFFMPETRPSLSLHRNVAHV
jgi:MFS family permease